MAGVSTDDIFQMNRYMADLTRQQLLDALTYDPDSGQFFWRDRPGARPVKSGAVAGCSAGTKIIIGLNGKLYAAHRLAWLYMTGNWPVALVDHVNGDPYDNRWSNLRGATQSENLRNRSKTRANTSGFKGVSLCKDTGRYAARIRCNYRTKYLGRYATPEEAHAAYLAAAAEMHGEFMKG